MKLRPIINFVMFLVTVAVNSLANILPINGRNTGEISDSIPALFTPAGYVFSIWSLIYLALLGFSIYQLLPAGQTPRLQRLGYAFAISGVFNTAWILAWHYGQVFLSVLIMLGLLATRIWIYGKLEIGIKPVSVREKWLVNLPFSIYLGWISVATIANISALGVTANWSGWGLSGTTWTIIMIVIATLLGLAMTFLRREVAYTLVLVWALIGIAVAQKEIPAINTTAYITAGTLVVALIISRLGLMTNRKTLVNP